MALDNAKNFAKATVSTGYDASATSVVLSSGHGSKMPTVPFNAVWWNSSDYPDPSDDPNVEIVRVTNVATDTLTVTRAQEGTSASTKNTGGKTYKLLAGLTALGANAIESALQGKLPYHGIQTTNCSLTFNDSTHVLTAGLVSSHFYYWFEGTKVDLTVAPACDLDDYVTLTTNTLYFVYFDDATGTLKASASAWSIVGSSVPVATVFWNGSAGAVYRETHSYTRNRDWHLWAHDTIGTRYEAGLTLTNPTTANDALLQIESGNIHDEDLDITISQQTTMRGWYKASANVFTFADYSLPYVGTSGQPKYLRTSDYSLQNVSSTNYVCMWVYATADKDRPIAVIPTHSTADHNTIALARAETAPSLSGLNLNPEWKLIYRFIYKGDGNFQESNDYRLSSPLPSGGASSTTASAVSFAPSGNVSSTTVQTAIEELDTEKQAVSNLVTSISGSSTDNQYPSAKLLYDQLALKMDSLIASRKVWTDTFAVTRSSDTAITFTSTALVANTIIGRIARWTDSGGTNVRRGFVVSATESGGTVTINLYGDAFASGDTNFRIGREGFEVKIKEWYVTGEQIADSTNPVGRQDVVLNDICVLSCCAYVGTAAAGTSADLKYDIYDDGTGIFTTDPSFSTNTSVLNSLPDRSSNKTLISAGSRITLRTPTSGGATNKASDLNVLMFYGFDDWWDAV